MKRLLQLLCRLIHEHRLYLFYSYNSGRGESCADSHVKAYSSWNEIPVAFRKWVVASLWMNSMYYRMRRAGASTVFEAIQHSQEIGLKAFDFEGAVISAIERYFRGFGGTLTPYFTVNKAWLPLEMALKMWPRHRDRF